MQYYNHHVENLNFYKNKFVIESLGSTLAEYFAKMKEIHGGRKQVFSIKFQFGDDTFEITENKTSSTICIFKKMLQEPFEYFNPDRKIRYDFEFTLGELMNETLDTFTGCTFDGEKIIFNFDNSNFISLVESMAKELEKFKAINKAEDERYESIKEDFTNYLHHEENAQLDFSIIENYLSIILKNKETIKLDKCKKFSIISQVSDGSYSQSIEIDHNRDLAEQIIQTIIKIASNQQDIVKVIPDYEGVSAKSLYCTDLLKFKFIYNDNFIAVNKHLEKVKGEAISAYYAERSGGGYCGD